MKIVHISDTHGGKGHTKLIIPECDVLIHSGDIGGRTNNFELVDFLIWFEKQPAKQKIWVAGNHDIILDKKWVDGMSKTDTVMGMVLQSNYVSAQELLKSYNVKYLLNEEFTLDGVKFWGSPYTPSFHRAYWAFNADRGDEIQKIWAKIPSDVNVLITHGPAFGVLDMVNEDGLTAWHKDGHVGCEDLMSVIKKRLNKLQLHCFGHIHDNYGVEVKNVSNNRRVMFSNGSVLTNAYTQMITNPLIITI